MRCLNASVDADKVANDPSGAETLDRGEGVKIADALTLCGSKMSSGFLLERRLETLDRGLK